MTTLEAIADIEKNDPTFDGETFAITRFSTEPEGLQLIANGVGKTASFPEDVTTHSLSREEKAQIRDGMKADFGYRGKVALVAARSAWRASIDSEDSELSEQKRQSFLDARAVYQSKGNKIG